MNPRIKNWHFRCCLLSAQCAVLLCIMLFQLNLSTYAHTAMSPINGLDIRYFELIEKASSDHYSPRPDNMLSDSQIHHFVHISRLAIDKYHLLHEQIDHEQKNAAHKSSCFKPLYRLAVAVAAKSTAIALINPDTGEIYSETPYNFAEYDWIYRQLRQAFVLQNIEAKTLDDSAKHNIDVLGRHIDQIQPILDFC